MTELNMPLRDVMFVAVDLETTGGGGPATRITEIGAVKIRGGELLGDFHTLIDPGVPIPAAVSAVTGITSAAVRGLPPVDAVLPAFLEFAHGATLVAHNARFDMGLLNANLERLGYPRLDNPVVCTAGLARRLVREEVRDCRLATLAAFFRCPTAPTHRALADARATVEVFHELLGRAGSFRVLTLEDLLRFALVRNTPLYRAWRGLADGLPNAPGVYAFRSAGGEILYVGKATDLRTRVLSYFGGDDRRTVAAMLREAEQIDHWICPTPPEAEIRELRLIHACRPRYNRRGRQPQRPVYLKLTRERYPRLSVVAGRRDDGACYLGPLASRRVAAKVTDALHDAVLIRRCTARITAATRFPACALAEMGRCLAPCEGLVTAERYDRTAQVLRDAFGGDPTTVLAPLERRLARLAEQGRYDEAAALRRRMRVLLAAVARGRRLAATAAAGLLVASQPVDRPGHSRDVVVARRGLLAASERCGAEQVEAVAARLARSPPTRLPDQPGTPGDGPAAAAEADVVARWLEGEGAQVHHCEGGLASFVAGGRALHEAARRLG